MDDFRKNCAKLDFKLFLIKNFSFILVRCAQPRASSVMVEKRVLTSLLALKLFELLFFASALHNCARSFLRSHLFFLLLVFYHMYHSYYTYCLINFSKAVSIEDVAWQNSMRLNRHEEFSRFGRVDRIKIILQNFYIIF